MGRQQRSASRSSSQRATKYLWVAVTLLGAGCATQREQRLSSAEARERPTDEACDEPRGKQPSPLHRWACGYWHWDKVHYVWVEGRWEPPR